MASPAAQQPRQTSCRCTVCAVLQAEMLRPVLLCPSSPFPSRTLNLAQHFDTLAPWSTLLTDAPQMSLQERLLRELTREHIDVLAALVDSRSPAALQGNLCPLQRSRIL